MGKNLSMSGRNESIDTRRIEPIIGPSIVPRPPITDIISDSKELLAEKNETRMYLR